MVIDSHRADEPQDRSRQAADEVLVQFIVATETRLYGEGLASCLASAPHWNSVGTTTNPAEVCPQVEERSANVVLIDVSMPDSATIIRTLASRDPQVHVVALVPGESAQDILPYVEAGVGGFVAKGASLDSLRETIENVLRGEVACAPQLIRSLMRAVHTMASQGPVRTEAEEQLTARQRKIAELLALGMANKEIASELHIGVSTVKNHVHALLRKLDLQRRGQIAARLSELGITPVRAERSA
jgi:DNA-binding NarL/FixJ family response regulator